jgi:hypothetical protein
MVAAAGERVLCLCELRDGSSARYALCSLRLAADALTRHVSEPPLWMETNDVGAGLFARVPGSFSRLTSLVTEPERRG